MKIISLNTFGATYHQPLRNYLIECGADVLLLQEVYSSKYDNLDVYPPGKGVTKQSIQSLELGEKYPNMFFSANYRVPYLDSWFEYGNAILSRHPIHSTKQVFIANSFIELPRPTYEMDPTEFPPAIHPRSFQVAEIQFDSSRYKIINLHGIYKPNGDKLDNTDTLKMTSNLLETASGDRVIIGGDFNLYPESDSIKNLSSKFRNLIIEAGITTTRKSSRPKTVIDYMFVSNDIKVNQFTVNPIEVSDHLPLELDIDT